MCGVVLSWVQLTRSVCHNSLVLHKLTTKSLKRSITEYFVGLGLIWSSENWSRDELFFESFECHFTIWRPVVLDILLQQVGKRLGNLGEVLNEPSTIAGKTKKASELLDVLRSIPVDNCFNFLGVYRNTVSGDDMA